jgi:Ureide permease
LPVVAYATATVVQIVRVCPCLQVAGYAAATVVQAYLLVGTLWGVLIFREFRGISGAAVVLLAAKGDFYFAAIGLLDVSASIRPSAGMQT